MKKYVKKIRKLERKIQEKGLKNSIITASEDAFGTSQGPKEYLSFLTSCSKGLSSPVSEPVLYPFDNELY